MRRPVRIYEIIHSEKITSKEGTTTVRLCAITDKEHHRLALLNNQKPVRIEKQVKGNKYEKLQEYDSLAEAVKGFPTWIVYLKAEAIAPTGLDLFDFE